MEAVYIVVEIREVYGLKFKTINTVCADEQEAIDFAKLMNENRKDVEFKKETHFIR